MKDDLISREAAIDAVKHAWAKGLEPSQYIEIIPTAPAVPLEPLANWLAEYAVPPVSECCITTEERTVAWKAVLNKFVEEQYE